MYDVYHPLQMDTELVLLNNFKCYNITVCLFRSYQTPSGVLCLDLPLVLQGMPVLSVCHLVHLPQASQMHLEEYSVK